MRKIQALALFIVLLLTPAVQPGADAARPRRQVQEPPKPTVMEAFQQKLQDDPFFSDRNQQNLNNEIAKYIDDLLNRKDKAEYIQKCQLNGYVEGLKLQLQEQNEKKDLFIQAILQNYPELDAQASVDFRNQMEEVLNGKLNLLDKNLTRLTNEMEVKEESGKELPWPLIGAIAGGLLLLIFIIAVISKNKGKKNNGYKPAPVTPRGPKPGYRAPITPGQQVSADGNIVVRRKTATILKKQSLEDVIDNPNYLQVDAVDFTYESAVRRMYIKNQCIIDIYNMYAEDLRNPDNPKEDGCMVLGRWVHDSESNEYYVSLEHVILPGDDAVFSEYELNFGGKIKLKVTEKLRKLRRETNLQYDLTCWVHSHPGLGVFFSNSDSKVQMQLKHPTHPNFLTAIVVDILTPNQEMGIFTFKPDSTLNAKSDLTRMYSLEELYKWAVESERNTFKPEDYFNTLAQAKAHSPECHGIQLSNGAIIDLGMLAIEQDSGLAGLIHGFNQREGHHNEVIANKVCKDKAVPDNELIGCFITGQHCSIPTVRKAIADYIDTIRFVLVYSASDGALTSIPVIDKELCTDVNYYGEQQLEDLKIWTRRKR